MANLDRITAMLRQMARVDQWVAIERRTRTASRTVNAKIASAGTATVTTDVYVYRDLRRGRGSAVMRLSGAQGATPQQAIQRAAQRAGGNIGPPWQMPPPAAPARVVVADPALGDNLHAAVDRLMDAVLTAAAKRTGYSLTHIGIGVESIGHDVRTSNGLATGYQETIARITATVAATATLKSAPERAEALDLVARRVEDLELDQQITAALARLRKRNDAAKLAAGRYDLLLPAGAISQGIPYRFWGPLVHQARADLAGKGLGRYRLGQSIYGATARTGDPLTLRSDGVRDFGLLSAPVGPKGEPVRPFDLVRDGIATGQSLDLEQAGLLARSPNGGVRNLVVEPGTTPGAALSRAQQRPLLTIEEFASLHIDNDSGRLIGFIGLGEITIAGKPQPITGGLVRGNLFDWLARARYARETVQLNWYSGPSSIRIDDVVVTA